MEPYAITETLTLGEVFFFANGPFFKHAVFLAPAFAFGGFLLREASWCPDEDDEKHKSNMSTRETGKVTEEGAIRAT